MLQQALLELLRDEPLSKVTITQIAARADVSRQAFYLHFSSKEELLFSHLDDVFREIQATVLPSPARPHAIGLLDLLTSSFIEWTKHADSLRLAMQIEDNDHLIERIRIHIAYLMKTFAEHGREEIVPHPMPEYTIDFITGGVYMLLRSWTRDDLATPPTQMAELAYSLIAGDPETCQVRHRGR